MRGLFQNGCHVWRFRFGTVVRWCSTVVRYDVTVWWYSLGTMVRYSCMVRWYGMVVRFRYDCTVRGVACRCGGTVRWYVGIVHGVHICFHGTLAPNSRPAVVPCGCQRSESTPYQLGNWTTYGVHIYIDIVVLRVGVYCGWSGPMPFLKSKLEI